MSHRLYGRWLQAGDTQTLSEFVATYRALERQARAQRRWNAHLWLLMQQTPQPILLQQQALLQNMPPAMYGAPLLAGIGTLIGGAFVPLRRL